MSLAHSPRAPAPIYFPPMAVHADRPNPASPEPPQTGPSGADPSGRGAPHAEAAPAADPTALDRDPLTPRQLFLHRRIVYISPRRLEVRPPKSTMVLPLFGLVLISALLAAVVIWIDSLPFWLLPVVLLASVVLLPLSGITLVYAIFGASIVADRDGQNVSVKQRFLGLGVGTAELIPFWKIREFVVEDVGRAQERADGYEPAHDLAQWELTLVKKSGKRVSLCGYSVPREHEEVGLDIVMDVGEAFATFAGAPLRGPIW